MRPTFESETYQKIRQYLDSRYQAGAVVYPEKHNIFRALKQVKFEDVKVVIIGQDPYHGPMQANGFAFAVKSGLVTPPSLRNILSEIEVDLNIKIPRNQTTLEGWAKQGVLLLNSCLTVEEGRPGSHAEIGWQQVTDSIIKTISDQKDHVVFILWGKFAQSKLNLINPRKHGRLIAAHPSPFSADKGFFGCRHFSQANNFLLKFGKPPIDWSKVDRFDGKPATDMYTELLGV